MPNWCSYQVNFHTTPDTLEKIKLLMLQLASKEASTNEGQLPEFFIDDRGYLFSIRWEEGILYYDTKWSPNTEVIKAIADHYNVGFVHYYDEPGMQIFGNTEYHDGVLNVTDLEEDDYAQFSYDENTDLYHFEGENYESEYEILEILVERKFEKLKPRKRATLEGVARWLYCS